MSDDTEITLIQTTRGSRSLAATVRACDRDYIGRMMSPTEYNYSFTSEAVGMYVYRSCLRAHNRPDCKTAVLQCGRLGQLNLGLQNCLPIYTIYNLVAHTGLEPLVLYRGPLYSVACRITIHTTARSIGCEVAQ